MSTQTRREMTFRERRRLGLTFGQLLRTAREVQSTGWFTQFENGKQDPASLRHAIAYKLASETVVNNKAGYREQYGEDRNIDWDRIIAIIVKYLPIILKAIGLLLLIF